MAWCRVSKFLIFACLLPLSCFAQGTSTAAHIRYGSALPATCKPSTGDVFFKTTSIIGPYYCSSTNTWALIGSGPGVQTHSVNFNISGGGSTITTGDILSYPGSGAATGTINRVDVSGYGTSGATCSITVDIWKRNAAIPTGSQKISASAPATLSSANLSQSGSLSGWTTSVSANDVWGASVASVTGCISALVQVYFQ